MLTESMLLNLHISQGCKCYEGYNKRGLQPVCVLVPNDKNYQKYYGVFQQFRLSDMEYYQYKTHSVESSSLVVTDVPVTNRLFTEEELKFILAYDELPATLSTLYMLAKKYKRCSFIVNFNLASTLLDSLKYFLRMFRFVSMENMYKFGSRKVEHCMFSFFDIETILFNYTSEKRDAFGLSIIALPAQSPGNCEELKFMYSCDLICSNDKTGVFYIDGDSLLNMRECDPYYIYSNILGSLKTEEEIARDQMVKQNLRSTKEQIKLMTVSGPMRGMSKNNNASRGIREPGINPYGEFKIAVRKNEKSKIGQASTATPFGAVTLETAPIPEEPVPDVYPKDKNLWKDIFDDAPVMELPVEELKDVPVKKASNALNFKGVMADSVAELSELIKIKEEIPLDFYDKYVYSAATGASTTVCNTSGSISNSTVTISAQTEPIAKKFRP